MLAPNTLTTAISVGPAAVGSGRRTSITPATTARRPARCAARPRPTGPGVQDRLGEHRQQRDRAAEQDREEVEQDRAEQDRRVADEADPAEQRLQLGRRAAGAPGPSRAAGSRAAPPVATHEQRRARRRRPPRARARTAGRRAPGPATIAVCVRDRAQRQRARQQLAARRAPAAARASTGNDSAVATPVAAASTRNGHSACAPDALTTISAAAIRDQQHGREPQHEPARDAVGELRRRAARAGTPARTRAGRSGRGRTPGGGSS